MNEKFNKNAKVEKFTNMLGIAVCLIVIDPLILINCVLGGNGGMRGKSLLNENAIIILSLNQSECHKLLQSASSRIGFSLYTGIEESACNSSCRRLLLVIRKRSSKDLFSLCFLLERPLQRTPWDRHFLRISCFNEKTLMLKFHYHRWITESVNFH